jgi:hypothetical protein
VTPDDRETTVSLRIQLMTGVLVLLTGAAVMAYAVNSLYGMPYLCAAVMVWLTLVEYAVARAWWVDVREVRRIQRARM